jgi:hypothetical protein
MAIISKPPPAVTRTMFDVTYTDPFLDFCATCTVPVFEPDL